MQPPDLELTHELIEFVKTARKGYYLDQKEDVKARFKMKKSTQKQAVIDQIEEYSQKIAILESNALQLNSDADKYGFEAEKENMLDVKFTLSKSNALKRATVEKQEQLEQIVERKIVLLETKQAISVDATV